MTRRFIMPTGIFYDKNYDSKIFSFGYIPKSKRNKVKDVIHKIVGYPHFFRRIQARSILRLAGSFERKTILDVGCGDGLFCIEYARRGAKKVVGIDVDEELIESGKVNVSNVGLNNVLLSIGNAECISVKSHSCDLIISNCALEHMENDEKVLKEINRCLRPDGYLVLTIPYDRRRKVLPIIDFMIKMPRCIQKVFAPDYIQGTHSYEEAIWKLKRERFKEVRNYSLEDIKNKLERANLKLIKYENNLKFFGAMCWDLIIGLRFFDFNRGMKLAFPVMYLISLLDELFPKHWRGAEMALKAKVIRTNPRKEREVVS